MRTTETTPVTIQQETIKATCDLCGRAATRSTPIENAWDRESFEVADTEIRCRTGKSYPDSGGGLEWIVDLCPQCFQERLVPWLRSQGAKIESQEWDW